MNLKEEINKCSYPAHQVAGLFPNDQVCNKKDVIHIAEVYAKEKVLDAVKAFKPKVPITSVLKWWEENK